MIETTQIPYLPAFTPELASFTVRDTAYAMSSRGNRAILSWTAPNGTVIEITSSPSHNSLSASVTVPEARGPVEYDLLAPGVPVLLYASCAAAVQDALAQAGQGGTDDFRKLPASDYTPGPKNGSRLAERIAAAAFRAASRK